jgi:hypothetical protein
MARLISGKFTISCDGIAFYASADGSFKYSGGFSKREAVLDSNGKVVGFKETPSAPYISGELIDNASLSVTDLSKITDSTITLDLANGKQIVLRGAYSTNYNGMEVEVKDGKVPIKFEGQDFQEVPAQ